MSVAPMSHKKLWKTELVTEGVKVFYIKFTISQNSWCDDIIQ